MEAGEERDAKATLAPRKVDALFELGGLVLSISKRWSERRFGKKLLL